MKEALVAWTQGKWNEMRYKQGESDWPTFRNASEDVLQVVQQKLEDRTYAHYVD
mgnify:CR=1 FL=1